MELERKEEFELRRSATPEKLIQLTIELRGQAEKALTPMLRELATPNRNTAPQGYRKAAATLKAAAAANSTLADTGKQGLMLRALAEVYADVEHLPPDIAQLWLRAETTRHTLFAPPSRVRRAEAYIFYALSPGSPEDTATVKDLNEGWIETVEECNVLYPGHGPTLYEMEQKLLPPRQATKRGRAWKGMKFDPEEARQAVKDITAAIQAGKKYTGDL